MHERNQSLLQALYACADACNHCFSACLSEKDVQSMAACIKLDRDCADFCLLTASFVARGSDHAKHLQKECVDICDACAKACAAHSGMDHCKACAEACRKCAEACRKAA